MKANRIESISLDVAYIGSKGGFRKQIEQLITEYKRIMKYMKIKGQSLPVRTQGL